MKRPSLTRRSLLEATGLALTQAAPFVGADVIPGLMPRSADGHQFVVYADCCSGRPGQPNEDNFKSVNRALARLKPMPQFISFPGDHIMALTKDYEDLRAQWKYWLTKEIAWLDTRAVPIYHTTSNHNTYSVESEQVWREVFPEIPRNGPPGQEGLSYYVRRDNLLLMCVNTSYSGLGGYGHVESEWLDSVLSENKDAAYKFAVGHHPVHPVNGYGRYPNWRIVPEQGRSFWKVLAKHRAHAYLCSHIIAFDVQCHEGVLQICTGGAGTIAGPGGFMPGRTEYHHLVQMAVDRVGMRYQVLDTEGKVRERLEWPLNLAPSSHWLPLTPEQSAAVLREAGSRKGQLCVWRFSGVLEGAGSGSEPQTLLCGWEDNETVATFWIGLDGSPPRLTVRLLPESGGGAEVWTGPAFRNGQAFDLQLAIHSGMGPGGVLFRARDDSPWSSLQSTSAKGAETLEWPRSWALGCSQSGPSDRPFRGARLKLSWTGRQSAW
jgi:hypothetical protein